MQIRRALAVLLAVVLPSMSIAHDRWEYVAYNATDEGSTTLNFLQHGAVQVQHDLESDGLLTAEQDWYAFRAMARHSYEARVNSGIMYWGLNCSLASCPRFDLVSPSGLILTAGQVSVDDAPIVIHRGASGPHNVGRGMTVRWIASVTDIGFLRAVTDSYAAFGPEVFYDISFRDTTYFAPRWNNSGTQVSVLIIQNTTAQPVAGDIDFRNSAGDVVATVPLAVPAHGVQVLNTASVPALAGLSGAATIAQTGGYGALTGKVVSLEPATGFTFDTAITPIPY